MAENTLNCMEMVQVAYYQPMEIAVTVHLLAVVYVADPDSRDVYESVEH